MNRDDPSIRVPPSRFVVLFVDVDSNGVDVRNVTLRDSCTGRVVVVVAAAPAVNRLDEIARAATFPPPPPGDSSLLPRSAVVGGNE